MNSEHPKVFISYSWEDEEHKTWVKELADRLLNDGVDASVDQYDLTLGDRLPFFMEQAIANTEYVLIICTPTYKEKSDERKGGVGYEGHIISGELFALGNEKKFIPVVRKGTVQNSLPACLSGKLAIDLTAGKYYEDSYKDLITTLYGAKEKPKLGCKPEYISKSIEKISWADSLEEPIRILGILTDEVSVPRLDGTRGSGLYKIPFQLSGNPSKRWSDYFVEAWNRPPSFSTMHRPGIASVIGSKVILNGTTIEEVRDYHRETLVLCIDVANQKESEVLRRLQAIQENKEMQKRAHYDKVNNISEDIEF